MIDRPIHPGYLIKTILKELGISIEAFSDNLKISRPTGFRLVNSLKSLTAQEATRVATALGNTPEFWMHLQHRYDAYRTKNLGAMAIARYRNEAPNMEKVREIEIYQAKYPYRLPLEIPTETDKAIDK